MPFLRLLLQKLLIKDKTPPIASDNPLQSEVDKGVDDAARLYLQKTNTVGLCIGIIDHDQTGIYSYGETALGTGSLPDGDSIFEIGSITKTFAAALLAHFILTGKMNADDPITKYLPADVALNPELKNIRIVHLSNHTSGLPRLPANLRAYSLRNPYQNYTDSKLFEALKTVRLTSSPGTVYAYSNLAVGLLGKILERVGGKSFEELVKQVITAPLGMSNTFQHPDTGQINKQVEAYNQWGKPTPNWDFQALAACGAFRSSINDLLLYARANMIVNDTASSQALQLTHRLTFSDKQKIGLGWHIFSVKGADYRWHNGGTGGCRSFIAFSTEQKTAVAVLSNSAVGCDALALSILKLMQK